MVVNKLVVILFGLPPFHDEVDCEDAQDLHFSNHLGVVYNWHVLQHVDWVYLNHSLFVKVGLGNATHYAIFDPGLCIYCCDFLLFSSLLNLIGSKVDLNCNASNSNHAFFVCVIGIVFFVRKLYFVLNSICQVAHEDRTKLLRVIGADVLEPWLAHFYNDCEDEERKYKAFQHQPLNCLARERAEGLKRALVFQVVFNYRVF